MIMHGLLVSVFEHLLLLIWT